MLADYYSRFPVVRQLKGLTAMETVEMIKKIFQEYGMPLEIFCDQGTQFTSQEFQDFAMTY